MLYESDPRGYAGMPENITVKAEDPRSKDASALMKELSDCLQAMTGSSGRHSIRVEDFLQARSLFAVARDLSGNAVGCGGFRPLDAHAAELKRMYARAQSSGVGSKILAYLEAGAARMGYAVLRLETRRSNKKAVAFYRRNGYLEIPNYGIYENRSEAACFEKYLSRHGGEKAAVRTAGHR
ncbi:Acetyltransferase (GNAT) family protein [Sporobacter termitidis DSM 10068]|uniref:Acetyltransferase (GNAT) family protein n=1 Tax=Sporobacter termitidis DSM 10068 TaxID=1123282 RepID=A0A1M5YY59_9FIRM|nr:GNAT family N-acetyltransferase [Sporobacter termitidis]SHI16870.1 Acetyltransferase (GNAT) family protein [Sporobacter termitidis DSM 10068]